MIFVDPICPCLSNANWRWHDSCHLFGDDEADPHGFARRIGLKRAWFQAGRKPHYDLTRSMRAKAVRAGAVEYSREQAVAFWRSRSESGAPPITAPSGAEEEAR